MSFPRTRGDSPVAGSPLPNPQFVEPVETNPEVTSAFAPHLLPFDYEDPLVCNSHNLLAAVAVEDAGVWDVITVMVNFEVRE